MIVMRTFMKRIATKKFAAVCATVAMIASLAACGGGSSSSSGTPVDGGTIKIALNANVSSLDPLMTGAYVARDTMRNIYETLVTLDANGNVVDLLAQSHQVSADNTTFTFTIRQGVKFHNGETMTANDVVASMQRWIKLSQAGSTFFNGATVTSPDANTVVIKAASPVSQGLYIMADNGRMAAIMPASVIEAAGDTGVTDYVGTGPFKFASWNKDQNITLDKFTDYSSPSGDTNGYAGSRKAHADHLEFDFVTDGNTRMTSTLSGDYQVGYSLADSQYAQLQSASNVSVQKDEMLETLLFNKKQGIFAGNTTLRQAILAALDMNKIAKAGHQNEDLYETDGGLMPKNSPLRSEAGLDNYNQANADKAKQPALQVRLQRTDHHVRHHAGLPVYVRRGDGDSDGAQGRRHRHRCQGVRLGDLPAEDVQGRSVGDDDLFVQLFLLADCLFILPSDRRRLEHRREVYADRQLHQRRHERRGHQGGHGQSPGMVL